MAGYRAGQPVGNTPGEIQMVEEYKKSHPYVNSIPGAWQFFHDGKGGVLARPAGAQTLSGGPNGIGPGSTSQPFSASSVRGQTVNQPTSVNQPLGNTGGAGPSFGGNESEGWGSRVINWLGDNWEGVADIGFKGLTAYGDAKQTAAENERLVRQDAIDEEERRRRNAIQDAVRARLDQVVTPRPGVTPVAPRPSAAPTPVPTDLRSTFRDPNNPFARQR